MRCLLPAVGSTQKLYPHLKTPSKAAICTRAGWDKATKAKQMLLLGSQIPWPTEQGRPVVKRNR